jgi:hypothetical protein
MILRTAVTVQTGSSSGISVFPNVSSLSRLEAFLYKCAGQPSLVTVGTEEYNL